jgi:hypothetical protein
MMIETDSKGNYEAVVVHLDEARFLLRALRGQPVAACDAWKVRLFVGSLVALVKDQGRLMDEANEEKAAAHLQKPWG